MALRSPSWKSPPSPSSSTPKRRCRRWPHAPGNRARAAADQPDRRGRHLRPEQQHAIGLLAHRHLAHLEKVASLVPPEKLTRVSEAAARAQGMELRVFSQLSDAIGWLVA
jgi:hypothetical protein